MLPAALKLAVWPSLPVLPSQAKAVIDTVPAKVLLVGTKRIRSLADSSKAAAVETVGNVVHDEPPVVEYCQAPLVVPARAVTATPTCLVASTSVKKPPNTAVIVLPAGVVVFDTW